MKQKYIYLKSCMATLLLTFLFAMGVSGQATLMHSYTFEDGTAADGTGTLDGTVVGEVTFADGMCTVEPAADGQGQNYGYVSFDGVALALADYSSITLEAMIVAGDGTNDFFTMTSYFGGNMVNYLFTQMTVGTADESAIRTIDDAGEKSVVGKRIDDGALHHLVVVLTSTSLSYYVDGELIGTTEGAGFITPIETTFAHLFRGPDGWNDDNWIGSFEEYNIYEGEMDAATVATNATAYLSVVDARLSDLEADLGTLTPEFAMGVTDYALVVPEGTATVTLTPTTNNASATSTGGGAVDVSAGAAVQTITVTAEDGVTMKDYTVMIGVVGAPDDTKLTHAYAFSDGTADDAVGDVDGVLNGGATVRDGSLVLEDGQFVSLDGKAIDLPSYDAITVEAWYTAEGMTNGGYHTVFGFGSNREGWMGVDYFQWQPARADDVSRLAVSCKNYAAPWEAENGVNTVETDDAMMHHVVGIMDDDGMKLYVDGLYIGSTLYTGNNAIDSLSSDTAFFGKSVYYGDPTWKGSIQDVKIYNTVLNPGQVAFQYEQGLEDVGYTLTNSFYDDPTDASDFYANAITTWDADSIYVQVDIMDEVLFNTHANSWENDLVELYFDMDNSKQNGPFDANDKQLAFTWDADNSAVLAGAHTTQADTDNGWMINVSIPWDSLMMDFDPAVDGIIGYDVQVIDNDGANRESKISMMALADEGWHITSYMGELKFLADGKTEPIYPTMLPLDGQTAYALGNSFYDDPADAADFSATAKTWYDMDSIYVFVSVSDDSIYVDHANAWENDMVELYFDMDNSKQDGAYDANDHQYAYTWGTGAPVVAGARSSETTTATGWTVDFAIPWDSIMDGFDPVVGGLIGYDVQAIDNDGVNRESKISMMALADEGWHVTAYMGTLEFGELGTTMPIYPTTFPWSAHTAYALENSFYDDPADAADFSATAKTKYDMDKIYVLVDIKDDSLDILHANAWERDMIELYFDMDNSKQEGAYDDNDYQLGFTWDTDNSGVLNGGAMSTQTTNDDGWSIEVTIPWDSLLMDFDPTVDTLIGYDVQVIDNDGAARESKISLMALADEAWQNVSYMGELNLLADSDKTMPIYKEPVIVEPEYYEQLYVIGDACSAGWNIGDALAMTADDADATLFTWEGPLTASEIKFETDITDWCQGDEITALEQGADAVSATGYQIRANADGSCSEPDNKWMVAEAGTYLITINLTDETISFVLQTSIKVDAFSNVSIYPNPTTDILHIANAEDVDVIELVNLVGQVTMRHLNSGNSSTVISVEDQEAGIYLVRFTGFDNETNYKKLIIK